MANRKISEDALLAAADIDGAADYLPLVDASAADAGQRNKRSLLGTIADWVVKYSTSFVQFGTGAQEDTVQGALRLRVDITQFMTAAQKADALLAAPVLDHASAMSAAVAKVMGAQGAISTRGGSIYIPAGYRIRLATDPFGVLPNDGESVLRQSPLRIFGAGCDTHTTTGTVVFKSASVIDFRYTTANNAKIDTRGSGVLEIDHLVMADESGNAEAFVHTTNTCVLIHDNMFLGSKTSAWDQDCVILGGTGTAFGTDASDAPFQGYGSQIYANHFHRIRRAVYARVFANGVPVYHNTVWGDCGFPTGAAFDYDGDPLGATETISGVPLHHNLVTDLNYKYGVRLDRVGGSTIGPNDFYDSDAGTTAHYTFDGPAGYNLVIGGWHLDTVTFVEEVGATVGTNTWITAHQSKETTWPQPFRFKGPFFIDAPSVSASGQQINGILAAKASLEFTILAANTSEEFDITVPGARAGDMVVIGMFNAQATLGGGAPTTFFAWVRANDTVRLRRSNVGTVNTADPAVGDVAVMVVKIVV